MTVDISSDVPSSRTGATSAEIVVYSQEVPVSRPMPLVIPAAPSGVVPAGEMPDLAPMIFRQRLVVEGRCTRAVTDTAIRAYLDGLSSVCEMTTLLEPVTHRSDLYGWAGWIHWENSGAHFYAWEKPILFFSADIYTCKHFDPDKVVAFTTEFFDADPVTARTF